MDNIKELLIERTNTVTKQGFKIEKLEQQLAAAQARDKELFGELSSFKDIYNQVLTRNEGLHQRIAAAQAREKVLMVAIESLVENVDRPPYANCSCHISPPCSDCVDYGGLREAFEWVDRALAMPTDDTALRAALAAERERCANAVLQRGKEAKNGEWVGNNHAAFSFAEAIRALGD